MRASYTKIVENLEAMVRTWAPKATDERVEAIVCECLNHAEEYELVNEDGDRLYDKAGMPMTDESELPTLENIVAAINSLPEAVRKETWERLTRIANS
jgi:hypothetical protein